jgi:uncharacterized DUF497 family protein
MPGHRWRSLAWNRKTGEKHAQRFNPADGVCFDELVIDDWFHLEQMNDRHWWIGLGRGGDLLHVGIQVKAKGQIEVTLTDESSADAPIIKWFDGRRAE